MSDIPLPPWVQKINKTRKERDDVSLMFFYLMKELHLSYADILEMPVPAILSVLDRTGERAKEQERKLKRSKR